MLVRSMRGLPRGTARGRQAVCSAPQVTEPTSRARSQASPLVQAPRFMHKLAQGPVAASRPASAAASTTYTPAARRPPPAVTTPDAAVTTPDAAANEGGKALVVGWLLSKGPLSAQPPPWCRGGAAPGSALLLLRASRRPLRRRMRIITVVVLRDGWTVEAFLLLSYTAPYRRRGFQKTLEPRNSFSPTLGIITTTPHNASIHQSQVNKTALPVTLAGGRLPSQSPCARLAGTTCGVGIRASYPCLKSNAAHGQGHTRTSPSRQRWTAHAAK